VLVPHGYLRRIRLAALWIWIGLVAVRQRWMGFRSGIRLDVHRSAAVGLAAVSLWRMGVRARNRLGVVVVWIWQRLPVAALDGSICAQAARADWRGADPSAG